LHVDLFQPLHLMIDVEHHRAHLRGEKPDELPVPAPTKFQLVVNVKAAKEPGLEIPATVLAQADDVA
jgi:ABC-type uncharacterized transport system substrate-binding protein